MEIKVVGVSCGQNGSCTFYKGLRVVIPSASASSTSRFGSNRNRHTNNSIKSKDVVSNNNNNSKVNVVNGKLRTSISSQGDGCDNDNNLTSESCENNKCDVTDGDKKQLDANANERPKADSSKTLILGMGDCIPVRPWNDSPIECLAEIRMIWRDKNEQSLLISLRLYFLPENTPQGRNCHGEDEVVAVKDLDSPRGAFIIRAEDFATWLAEDLKWNWGLEASYHGKPVVKLISSSNGLPVASLLSNTKLDFTEVEAEKIADGNIHSNVTVLSYSRYCRYRAALRRVEGVEDDYIRIKLIETLSGFVASQPNTRIMFAKETIDYPDLEAHEMLCSHLAPKLKGRPRGRRKKVTTRASECISPAPSSEYSIDSCETNDSDAYGTIKAKNRSHQRVTRNKIKSDNQREPVYTTLSTGRVTKQRLPLTPSKISTNKRKKNPEVSDESESSSDEDDDNEQDEDYDDKYVNRKRKLEGGTNSRRQNSSSGNEEKAKKDEKDIQHYMPQQQHQQQHYQQYLPPIAMDPSKSPEELDFLQRLNRFMAERAYAYPKLIWSLRDVNLYTIYTRVQKLGGFDAIADNRVWKNLFEDLSTPNGSSVTQGMTKRKYERVLLPFERYERERRANGDQTSEITISTIPKNGIHQTQSNNVHYKKRSASPAIEIIPIKNGATSENVELTPEQMTEIQNIIKPKDGSTSSHHHNGNSSDGFSMPVSVIIRPPANCSPSDPNNALRNKYQQQAEDLYYNNKMMRNKQDRRNSYQPPAVPSLVGQQKPNEKENIPMMLHKQSTSIVPLNRDGLPAFASSDVIELADSDDEHHRTGQQPMKKRKLDILREGGLEVTPISRGQMENLLMLLPRGATAAATSHQQPKVSLTSLPPVHAPPVIQSLNMYQPTTQVFKNPKEEVDGMRAGAKNFCLDLTRKRPSSSMAPENLSIAHRSSQPSLEEFQRNYRESNPDLQITLVKSEQQLHQQQLQQQHRSQNGISHNSPMPLNIPRRLNAIQKSSPAPEKKQKTTIQIPQGIPPLNPTLIAAANELQKRNMLPKHPMFNGNPFLTGLDITPSHLDITPLPQSAAMNVQSKPPQQQMSIQDQSMPSPAINPLLSYLTALYANPMPMFPNLQNPADLLKFYQKSLAARVPSSKS